MNKSIDIELSEYLRKKVIQQKHNRFCKVRHCPSENAVWIEKCKEIDSPRHCDDKCQSKNRITEYSMRFPESVPSETFFELPSDPAEYILEDPKRAQEGTIRSSGKNCNDQNNDEA